MRTDAENELNRFVTLENALLVYLTYRHFSQSNCRQFDAVGDTELSCACLCNRCTNSCCIAKVGYPDGQ